jgi:hypothetical protein
MFPRDDFLARGWKLTMACKHLAERLCGIHHHSGMPFEQGKKHQLARQNSAKPVQHGLPLYRRW